MVKFVFKCHCINGSILNCVREPMLYSFNLSKPSGYKVYFQPETKHYEKINVSVWSNIRFYLEADDKQIWFYW